VPERHGAEGAESGKHVAVRMSDSEAIMWAVEKDPALRSDFCNVTILEHRPDEARVRARLDAALDVIPRLRQRVVSAPLRIVPPEFADDPTLDVDAHIRTVAVPAPGDMRALLDVCEGLTEPPLDRARPLWEFTLLEGLAGGRVALLQRLHHTITDGVGGLRLSLALVDFEPDPQRPLPFEDAYTEPQAAVHRGSPVDVARAAARDAAARGFGAARRAANGMGRIVTHPTEVPTTAAGTARALASLQRQGLVTERARSDVMVARSLGRRFEVLDASLAGFRRTAQSLGGSVNDAYITAIAAALGRYHERFDSEASELRLAMPVSTRERGDTGANRFAPARVVIPIQPAHDIPSLFRSIHTRLRPLKNEEAFGLVDSLAGFVSGLPTALLVAMTRSQARTIDFAASNLRGSPVPLYLGGSRILSSYPFGPRTGTALNVTTLSYCDELHVGFNVDPAAIADSDAFMRDANETFAEVAATA
jgi:diacylglycerol O-acyltransferase / wax synthase